MVAVCDLMEIVLGKSGIISDSGMTYILYSIIMLVPGTFTGTNIERIVVLNLYYIYSSILNH